MRIKPFIDFVRVGGSRFSLGAFVAGESAEIYGAGYGHPPTGTQGEAYLLINLLFWSLSIGVNYQKEAE